MTRQCCSLDEGWFGRGISIHEIRGMGTREGATGRERVDQGRTCPVNEAIHDEATGWLARSARMEVEAHGDGEDVNVQEQEGEKGRSRPAAVDGMYQE